MVPLSYHRLCVGRLRLNGSAWVAPPPRMRTPLLPKGGVWVAIVNKSRRLPRCEPRSCSLRKPQRFRRVGAKTCFGGCAPMQQGRQECRPSDGPATLLSPMVATKACFAPPPPTLSRSPETASASRCWALKSVSYSRGKNLFWGGAPRTNDCLDGLKRLAEFLCRTAERRLRPVQRLRGHAQRRRQPDGAQLFCPTAAQLN